MIFSLLTVILDEQCSGIMEQLSTAPLTMSKETTRHRNELL